jgi:hypothetical protein
LTVVSGELKSIDEWHDLLSVFFCLTREFELIVEFHHNQVLHEDLLVVEIVCEINQQEHGLLYHHQHLWKNFPIKYGLTIQEKKKF